MSQSDFVTRGQALVSSGQYQEAVKVCRLGLLGRPTTVEGRVVLGQALLALKRFDEVLAEMRVALELDHTSVPAQVLKGEALLRKGDGAGAMDVLGALRSQGVADQRALQLIAEAERIAGRSPPNASATIPRQGPHPGAGAAAPPADPATKHYPAADPSPDGKDDPDDDPDADPDDGPGDNPHQPEDSGGEFTRPTSLAAPAARKRPAPAPLHRENTPPPAVLAVGDRSGTMEVDPDHDGVELRPGDDDLGELIAPPPSRQMSAQMSAQKVSAQMSAQKVSAQMSAQKMSAQISAQKMSAQKMSAQRPEPQRNRG
ncbi:MAG TPA: hypothetical protein VGC42_22265, partial [Kofleriaceae bacterium]